MTWKTDEEGQLYKDVEIESEAGTKEYEDEIFAEMAKMAQELIDEEPQIRSKRFRDKRTGEIVTQFHILDIGYMEELDD